MAQAELCGCYDFNEEWYLVEMILDETPARIDWGAMTVSAEGADRANW